METTSRHFFQALVFAGMFFSNAFGQLATSRVGDITRLQGEGTNVLVGYGLVTGLSGTGDGSKFVPTLRALGATLRRFGANLESPEDIDAGKNSAIVMIEAVIPPHGAREGDQLDIHITALAAKSLEGGRLMSTPLIYHDRSVEGLFGFAQGRVVLDTLSKTAGMVKRGARIERDVLVHVVATGADLQTTGFDPGWVKADQTYLTLVLDDAHAGWSMAAAIAQALDKELSVSAGVDRVALAMDQRNVVVLLPEHQRSDPASWIRDVEQTPLLMEADEARVTINRQSGTIVVTGDTRLSPIVVSQMGMTVTIADPSASGRRPSAEQQDFVAVDTEADRLPSVRDLLESLNRLKVPFKDRVSILEQIHRAGKLHAKLMYEG
ncbi:MAG: flagellar basal body P-ring protein FlgI [Planctomycetota bacterium]